MLVSEFIGLTIAVIHFLALAEVLGYHPMNRSIVGLVQLVASCEFKSKVEVVTKFDMKDVSHQKVNDRLSLTSILRHELGMAQLMPMDPPRHRVLEIFIVLQLVASQGVVTCVHLRVSGA